MEKIHELWLKSPDEFNEWRKENDLPKLFRYFSEKLPGFEEWLSINSLKMNDLLDVTPTGSLFRKDSKLWVIKYDGKTKIEKKRINNKKIITQKKIIPYLKWAKEKYDKNFIKKDKTTNQYTDTFIYNAWEGYPGSSRAKLFQEFEVLKLGGVRIPIDSSHQLNLSKRNLDFVDLDFLYIDGKIKLWGEWEDTISFSSCRNIKITNANLHSFNFYQCNFQNPKFENSYIQGFKFIESEIHRSILLKCEIKSLSFDKCEVSKIRFVNCDINSVNYNRINDKNYNREYQNFRVLRVSFQNQGKREQAQKFYYKERCYKRLTLLYMEKFKINKLLKYFVSLFEYLIWGYGEKPHRTAIFMLLLIFLFSIVYYFFYGEQELYHSFINSLYFSIVTFTTLGYGDIQPENTVLKFICGCEALSGALLIALFIVGLTNKTKY